MKNSLKSNHNCFTITMSEKRVKRAVRTKKDDACSGKTFSGGKKIFLPDFKSIIHLTALVEELSRKICPSSNGKICIPWKSSSIAKYIAVIQALYLANMKKFTTSIHFHQSKRWFLLHSTLSVYCEHHSTVTVTWSRECCVTGSV